MLVKAVPAAISPARKGPVVGTTQRFPAQKRFIKTSHNSYGTGISFSTFSHTLGQKQTRYSDHKKTNLSRKQAYMRSTKMDLY